jgi:hypothetical protein
VKSGAIFWLLRRALALSLLLLLAAAIPAAARASMSMQIGAAEDEGRNADPAVARAKMDLAEAAGFNAMRVTAIWAPGENAVPPDQLLALQSVSAAAAFDGITIWATVMPYGSRTTPLTPLARRQFASFAADLTRRVPAIPYLIIGNEPNINRYWLPQFKPDGSDAAASTYESLLAQSYDAVKKVNRDEFVIGGSVSPHGSDDPTNPRQTHSPTAFITDLGAAYRASGRTKPIMDGFAFHPYGENSSVPPTERHPNSTSLGIADYDTLIGLLADAFDGTAQPGSSLPIVYDEYGIESSIPAAKSSLYHGAEPKTTKPVPLDTQGQYYDQALTMTACQPNVMAMFLFHVTDETNRNRWQSGVYYPDDTPKPSRAAVLQTIDHIRSGGVDCTAEAADNAWRDLGNAPIPQDKTKGKANGKGKHPRRFDPTAAWRLVGTF